MTTTDLRYAGDAVVQESVAVNGGASTVSRTYATDDTGRIVAVCDPDCASGTIYLVVYNGHGDATGLWRQQADGTLALANSYTYGTWGSPTTTTHNGYGDLGFRYLYVGGSDVAWDNAFGLGLLSMHAHSYSPSLGRFLQPDPARADANRSCLGYPEASVSHDFAHYYCRTRVRTFAPWRLSLWRSPATPGRCRRWSASSSRILAINRGPWHGPCGNLPSGRGARPEERSKRHCADSPSAGLQTSSDRLGCSSDSRRLPRLRPGNLRPQRMAWLRCLDLGRGRPSPCETCVPTSRIACPRPARSTCPAS